MAISPQFLDEMRSRLSLSDIIGRRIKVIRAGREHKACCPFHHEKTPSFTINDEKQFYHCFGCGAHGDVVKFVMEHDNMPFRDAVEMLAAEAGMQVPKEDPRAIEKAKKAKDLYDLMQEATNFFSSQLHSTTNTAILNYLQGRGISGASIDHFNIGYAPDDSKALITHLKREGYDEKDMASLGLIKTSDKSGAPYAFFRERVIFPVADRRGRIIAFGGRTLPDHMRAPSRGDFKPPKYLNSPETPIFDKGRVLYGEDKARKAAGDGRPVLVTEGYMDVVACHQAGFTGAVAPMGTALTEGQIDSLWKMIADDYKQPILCFDGDRAGRQAASRASERILPMLRAGCTARFAFMPDGEDPDSLIKDKGRAALSELLDSSISLIDYVWKSHLEGKALKAPEERAIVIKTIKSQIETIADDDVKSHYRTLINERISDTFFARKGGNNSSWNNKGFGQARNYGRGGHTGNGGFNRRHVTPKPLARPKSPIFNDLFPKILLAALVNHPHIFDSVEEQASQIGFTNHDFNALKEAALLILSNDPDCTAEDLQQQLRLKAGDALVDELLSQQTYQHGAFAAPDYDPASDNAAGEEVKTIAQNWLDIWNALKKKNASAASANQWKEKL